MIHYCFIWISFACFVQSHVQSHQTVLKDLSSWYSDNEIQQWIPWLLHDDEKPLEPVNLRTLYEDADIHPVFSVQFLSLPRWKLCEMTHSIHETHSRPYRETLVERRLAIRNGDNATRTSHSLKHAIHNWNKPHMRDSFVEVVSIYSNSTAELHSLLNECHVWITSGSEVFAPYRQVSPETLLNEKNDPFEEKSKDKVYNFVKTGHPNNRIDVVFLADGYTEGEEKKFVKDVKRLVRQMWIGPTFRTVLPLFNVWGLFRASKDHGIGVGGTPKDTAFGLYREGTELRGIYCGKPRQARQACRSFGQSKAWCDYPALLANDEFYGGLGGEYITTTSSSKSGSIVYRHEFGHSVVGEGEEYDGGYVYSGPNSAHSLQNIPWKSWLTTQSREEHSHLNIQEYPWANLEYGSYTIPFESSGNYKRWLLRFSISGASQDDSVRVFLDGKKLTWKSCGHEDRCFYDIKEKHGLSKGKHELTFVAGKDLTISKKIASQLCSVNLNEYGDEDDFKWSDDFVSAYPTWDINWKKSYRPTNEACLMRNMMSDKFCPICKEGMWMSLLKRVSLLDKVEIHCHSDSVSVRLKLIGRKHYRVRWFQGQNQEVNDLEDKVHWTRQYQNSQGPWEARISFSTSEVRDDPKGLLEFEHRFTIKC
jgi:hypothetical protein